jgi:AraC-like DNA-binding protein
MPAGADVDTDSPRERRSRALSPSRSGDVRIGPIVAIPALLRESGVRPEVTFARAGVDLRLFRDPDNRLSLEAVGRLLDACVAGTGLRHFGLLVGQRFDLKGFGPISELMSHSATLGNALRILVRHLHLQDRGGAPVLLSLDRSSAVFGYSIIRQGTTRTEQIYDAAIAIGYRILCELCGPSFKPLRVQFSHSRPDNAAPYVRLFRSDVVFDAGLSGIVFDSQWLSRPIEGADAGLRSRIEQSIREAEADGPMRFSERVENVLYQLLPGGGASAGAVASELAVSERTLRRRLHEEGIGLRQLVNRMRYELARQLLGNTGLSVSEIAAALEYADPNVFSRAFRSWASCSPTQWRAQR